jgi:hypothetical protein
MDTVPPLVFRRRARDAPGSALPRREVERGTLSAHGISRDEWPAIV